MHIVYTQFLANLFCNDFYSASQSKFLDTENLFAYQPVPIAWKFFASCRGSCSRCDPISLLIRLEVQRASDPPHFK